LEEYCSNFATSNCINHYKKINGLSIERGVQQS
jgi:hypothetical protein